MIVIPAPIYIGVNSSSPAKGGTEEQRLDAASSAA